MSTIFSIEESLQLVEYKSMEYDLFIQSSYQPPHDQHDDKEAGISCHFIIHIYLRRGEFYKEFKKREEDEL